MWSRLIICVVLSQLAYGYEVIPEGAEHYEPVGITGSDYIQFSWIHRAANMNEDNEEYDILLKLARLTYSKTSLSYVADSKKGYEFSAGCVKFIRSNLIHQVSCSLPLPCGKPILTYVHKESFLNSIYVCHSSELSSDIYKIYKLVPPRGVVRHDTGVKTYLLDKFDITGVFDEFLVISSGSSYKFVHKSCDFVYPDINSTVAHVPQFYFKEDEVCFKYPSHSFLESCDGYEVPKDQLVYTLNPVFSAYSIADGSKSRISYKYNTAPSTEVVVGDSCVGTEFSGFFKDDRSVLVKVCPVDYAIYKPFSTDSFLSLLYGADISQFLPREICVRIEEGSLNPITYAIESAINALESLIIRIVTPIIQEIVKVVSRLFGDLLSVLWSLPGLPELFITHTISYYKLRDHYLSFIGDVIVLVCMIYCKYL